MEKIKIGIIGCGGIAKKIARTFQVMDTVEAYAVASRSLDKATAFAAQWNFTKAYGSYEEMLKDKEVELVYIATPHSEHYRHALLCLQYDKPVICEKPMTVNAKQAEELISKFETKGVFLGEALWTRFMPSAHIIDDVISSGIIGKPACLSVNLGYHNVNHERLHNPELAGGALLDLGVYLFNFAAMVFGSDVEKIVSSCVKFDTGVDAQDSITLHYRDGRVAVMYCTMLAITDRMGIISGDKGHVIVKNINNPEQIIVVDQSYKTVRTIDVPKQITGYEYEFTAAAEALRNGKLECDEMPHAETLRIMKQMDGLRKEWNIVYPFEK